MDSQDRAWLRALPLLVVAWMLLAAAGLLELRKGDEGGAIALLAAALVVLGAWLTTAVLSWAARQRTGEKGDDPTAGL